MAGTFIGTIGIKDNGGYETRCHVSAFRNGTFDIEIWESRDDEHTLIIDFDEEQAAKLVEFLNKHIAKG